MASVLQVEELRGPTTGANANKVIIPSGQTLDISGGALERPYKTGEIVQTVIYNDPDADRGDQTFSSNQWITPTYGGSERILLTITPTSASNQILITFTASMVYNGDNAALKVRLIDNNGAQIGGQFAGGWLQNNLTGAYQPMGGTWLHAPNTTSAQTYKIQIHSTPAAGNIDFPHSQSSITLKAEEIQA